MVIRSSCLLFFLKQNKVICRGVLGTTDEFRVEASSLCLFVKTELLLFCIQYCTNPNDGVSNPSETLICPTYINGFSTPSVGIAPNSGTEKGLSCYFGCFFFRVLSSLS